MPVNFSLPLTPSGFKPVLTVESGQCMVRIVAGLLCVAYTVALGGKLASTAASVFWLESALAYLVFAYVWVWVAHYHLGTRNQRVLIALSLDQVLMAVYLHFGGAPAMLWAWGLPFANIGHGLRFGPRYSNIGAVIGTLAAGVAFATSQYWQSVPYVSIGLLALYAILPVYVSKLASKVWGERRESMRYAKHLEIAAKTDYLTGALNRKGFEEALRKLLFTDVNREPCIVMLLDLDSFKSINDKAGHGAGDAVLRQVVQRIRGLVRKEDIFARLGGDEFGLVVLGTAAPAKAEELISTIQVAVASITVKGYPALRVGVSIGYKLVGAGDTISVDSLLAAADERMYVMKRGVSCIPSKHASL